MITYWRQPGNKTLKRQTSQETQHVPTEKAEFEIALFKKQGWEVIDDGHKITIKK